MSRGSARRRASSPGFFTREADGGLEAGDEQADGLDQQLLGVEAVAVLFGGDEAAEQVVAAVAAALLDQVVEVAGQPHARALDALDHLGRGVAAADREAVGGVGGPLGEEVAVFHRHAQHLADERRGDRQRQVGDQVHLAAVGDAVEQLVGDGLDARPPGGDGARREGLRDQQPQPRVFRRVGQQHELAAGVALGLFGRLPGQRAVGAAHAGAREAQRAQAVVVAHEPPHAVGREAHRVRLAQPPVVRIGIVDVVRVEGVGPVPARLGALRAADGFGHGRRIVESGSWGWVGDGVSLRR